MTTEAQFLSTSCWSCPDESQICRASIGRTDAFGSDLPPPGPKCSPLVNHVLYVVATGQTGPQSVAEGQKRTKMEGDITPLK